MKITFTRFRLYSTYYFIGMCTIIRTIFVRKRLCVVILTQTTDSDIAVRRAVTGYSLNKSVVDFCVVESGKSNITVDVKYYLRPDIPFHYNKYIQYALSSIDLEYYDAVIISNDDVIPLPNALDKLSMSGFDSCSPVDPTVNRWKGLWRSVIGYEVEYHVCGWCLYISTKLIKRIGYENLFHDRYHFYLQDVFYAKLLKALGVIHGVVPGSKVIHLEHQTAEKAEANMLEYHHLIQHLDHDVVETVGLLR
jgi:hypothetical protein